MGIGRWQLNWKELAQSVERARPFVEGARIDKVIVPARSRFVEGYLKCEWALLLSHPSGKDGFLWISLRPQRVAVIGGPQKEAPVGAKGGTLSAFLQWLSSNARGAKIQKLETVERERWVRIHLSTGHRLELSCIPAQPEGWVVDESGAAIAQCRKPLAQGKITKIQPPKPSPNAPANPPMRFDTGSAAFVRELEKDLDLEAFEARRTRALSEAREQLRRVGQLLKKSQTALRESASEQPWREHAQLLLAHASTKPKARLAGKKWLIELPSYEDPTELISVPVHEKDTALSATALAQKFFELSKRSERRQKEAQTRLEEATGKADALAELQRRLHEEKLEWKDLESIERALNISLESQGKADPKTAKRLKRTSELPGRQFTSRNGWAIWIGRNKKENLELTLKHARGNDMWLHVKGKPSSHAVIPVPTGKSVPLETLLDAAQLVLHYSGGKEWGKTEVDYTFRKNVKRIPGTDEVRYTQNKTLMIVPDPKLIAKLVE